MANINWRLHIIHSILLPFKDARPRYKLGQKGGLVQLFIQKVVLSAICLLDLVLPAARKGHVYGLDEV